MCRVRDAIHKIATVIYRVVKIAIVIYERCKLIGIKKCPFCQTGEGLIGWAFLVV